MERDKELKVLIWPQNSPDPDLSERPWDENLLKMEVPLCPRLGAYMDQKYLITYQGC